MKTIKKRRYREVGTELLEFALAAPVLILLGLIILEFAGAVRSHQVLNNAAREGARLSSLPENQCPDPSCLQNSAIQDAVLDYLCRNGVPNHYCDVTAPILSVTVNQNFLVPGTDGINMATSLVTVSSPYPLPLISRVQGLASYNSITLQGRAQFRNFY